MFQFHFFLNLPRFSECCMFWLLKVRNEICSAAQGDAGTEEGKKIKVWLELLGGKISGQNQHFAQLQKKEKN